jgi:hypothetical protein
VWFGTGTYAGIVFTISLSLYHRSLANLPEHLRSRHAFQYVRIQPTAQMTVMIKQPYSQSSQQDGICQCRGCSDKHAGVMARYLFRNCPRCAGYIGIVLRDPQPACPGRNGHCLNCDYRLAWIVIRGGRGHSQRHASVSQPNGGKVAAARRTVAALILEIIGAFGCASG